MASTLRLHAQVAAPAAVQRARPFDDLGTEAAALARSILGHLEYTLASWQRAQGAR